ncbi:protein of unknown function [Methylocella tundrae]|jgi:hypothetical protein|uniref:Uncharacterized protein n=1 Tax=Methylocella tundrae TaxID=227605 RepID=A0A4U8YWD5_METTU|nr:protein of unknown function [Methylocella tundrae]
MFGAAVCNVLTEKPDALAFIALWPPLILRIISIVFVAPSTTRKNERRAALFPQVQAPVF